ncbi:hypothetical protein IWZ01DRAFT_316732 [Phyllosticta capitalensis]
MRTESRGDDIWWCFIMASVPLVALLSLCRAISGFGECTGGKQSSPKTLPPQPQLSSKGAPALGIAQLLRIDHTEYKTHVIDQLPCILAPYSQNLLQMLPPTRSWCRNHKGISLVLFPSRSIGLVGHDVGLIFSMINS